MSTIYVLVHLSYSHSLHNYYSNREYAVEPPVATRWLPRHAVLVAPEFLITTPGSDKHDVENISLNVHCGPFSLFSFNYTESFVNQQSSDVADWNLTWQGNLTREVVEGIGIFILHVDDELQLLTVSARDPVCGYGRSRNRVPTVRIRNRTVDIHGAYIRLRYGIFHGVLRVIRL
ncbi:hypothetical protein C8R45DRAFT_940529 [Mycena sanguinolenta]|nr:hypothetical protein C8R45DRAFT_940529 [Mycena sanguinolenta]